MAPETSRHHFGVFGVPALHARVHLLQPQAHLAHDHTDGVGALGLHAERVVLDEVVGERGQRCECVVLAVEQLDGHLAGIQRSVGDMQVLLRRFRQGLMVEVRRHLVGVDGLLVGEELLRQRGDDAVENQHGTTPSVRGIL